MLEIFDCPPEIIDLIINELVSSPAPASTSELRCSVHQRLSRRILPLGLTCRFFYRFILPRLYSNCFLEFCRLPDEDPRCRLYDSSVLGTIQKYNGFLQNGTLVKNLNIRFAGQAELEHPVQGWTTEKWAEFQEVSQSVSDVLGNLVPKFDNLRRVEFQRNISPRPQGSLEDFVRGVFTVLSRVTSLAALDLSIQWGAGDLVDWPQEGVKIDYSGSTPQLHELSLSIEPKLPDLDFDWDEDLTESQILEYLWFMDILIDLLQAPSQTVKALNFEFILDEFDTYSLGRRWRNSRDRVALGKARKQLEFPVVEKLNLSLGSGCQLAYEHYLKVPHGEVKDLSLQLIMIPGGTWAKEIPFIKSFPNLATLTLYHPRDIKPIEAVVASLSQFTRLKELIIFLFESATQVKTIAEKFEKDPQIQIKRPDSATGFAVISLHF
ncbi:hypothetical protein TWF281_009401 [Arthrobotrys megalospora]